MTREHIPFPDGRSVPIKQRRPPITRKPRTNDRQQPCGTCGLPWALGFDHATCKEQP